MPFVQALKAMDYIVVPLSGALDPEPHVRNPIAVIGGYSLVKAAHRRGWGPGVFYSDQIAFPVYARVYGRDLLNHDARVCRFGDLRLSERSFIPLSVAALKGPENWAMPVIASSSTGSCAPGRQRQRQRFLEGEPALVERGADDGSLHALVHLHPDRRRPAQAAGAGRLARTVAARLSAAPGATTGAPAAGG